MGARAETLTGQASTSDTSRKDLIANYHQILDELNHLHSSDDYATVLLQNLRTVRNQLGDEVNNNGVLAELRDRLSQFT